jgi:hypothetical protein
MSSWLRNPTDEVGGLFIPNLLKNGGESENPTDEVGGLFIPNLLRTREESENPTDEVGGSFIPNLLKNARGKARIPPTKSVDCSYLTY